MKAKWVRSKKSKSPQAQDRRKVALKKLEEDLKNGTIRLGDNLTRPIEEKDRKRIINEIENIKQKL